MQKEKEKKRSTLSSRLTRETSATAVSQPITVLSSENKRRGERGKRERERERHQERGGAEERTRAGREREEIAKRYLNIARARNSARAIPSGTAAAAAPIRDRLADFTLINFC